MSHIEPMPASGSLASSSSLEHRASRSRSMTLRHRIDWFFFRPSRPINLAICRILFFLGVLIFHLPRDLSNWASVPKNYWHPVFMFNALHLTVMSAHHLKVAFTIWKIALVCSCIGFFTRFSNIIALIFGAYVLGLPNNFGKVGHGDPVLIFTMLIFALSRCGDALSIDALIRRQLKWKRPHRSGEYTWPIKMAWVLLSIVFCAAGATKLIRSGTAWVTSDNLQILLLQHQIALKAPLTTLGLHIARHPLLCKVLAGMSVTVELLFPLSLFSRRLRFLLVPGAFLMQIGIGLAMGVYFTQFMISYLFWIPWDWITRVVHRRRLQARRVKRRGGIPVTSPASRQ